MPDPLIGQLLPAGVVVAEVVGEPPGGDLFPIAEQVVARAVGGRRAEFATGRARARRAMGG